jgi:hypothetical protein
MASVVIIGDATVVVGVAVIGATAAAAVMVSVTVNAEIHGRFLDSESVSGSFVDKAQRLLSLLVSYCSK